MDGFPYKCGWGCDAAYQTPDHLEQHYAEDCPDESVTRVEVTGPEGAAVYLALPGGLGVWVTVRQDEPGMPVLRIESDRVHFDELSNDEEVANGAAKYVGSSGQRFMFEVSADTRSQPHGAEWDCPRCGESFLMADLLDTAHAGCPMTDERARELVAADVWESYPRLSVDEAVEHARATVHLPGRYAPGAAEWQDDGTETAYAYRVVLSST